MLNDGEPLSDISWRFDIPKQTGTLLTVYAARSLR